MNRWKGKWALITGASAGIGKALAEQLAQQGVNLALTARRVDRLETLAGTLRNAHQVQVECFGADLENASAPQEIFEWTQSRGLEIALLINNAGFGAYGEFQAAEAQRQTSMVAVNCSAVVALTHLFLPAMIERHAGDILILASTAAFQPVPYLAVYAATKAFDLFFAQALAQEVKRHGVRVCALCPGATTTEFQEVSNSQGTLDSGAETPEKVARVGLEALAAGNPYVISGLRNWLGVESQRLAPRNVVTAAAEALFRPKHLK